jgi:hypothetical protein
MKKEVRLSKCCRVIIDLTFAPSVSQHLIVHKHEHIDINIDEVSR